MELSEEEKRKVARKFGHIISDIIILFNIIDIGIINTAIKKHITQSNSI